MATELPAGMPNPNLPFPECLDDGIRDYVVMLQDAGVHTVESCQGGDGHAFPEPTILFTGPRDEGFRALAHMLEHDVAVQSIRRTWSIIDGEPTGPHWEMTFPRLASGGTE